MRRISLKAHDAVLDSVWFLDFDVKRKRKLRSWIVYGRAIEAASSTVSSDHSGVRLENFSVVCVRAMLTSRYISVFSPKHLHSLLCRNKT